MTWVGGGEATSWLLWEAGTLVFGKVPTDSGGNGLDDSMIGGRAEPGGSPSLRGRPRGRLAGLPGKETETWAWGGCIEAHT